MDARQSFARFKICGASRGKRMLWNSSGRGNLRLAVTCRAEMHGDQSRVSSLCRPWREWAGQLFGEMTRLQDMDEGFVMRLSWSRAKRNRMSVPADCYGRDLLTLRVGAKLTPLSCRIHACPWSSLFVRRWFQNNLRKGDALNGDDRKVCLLWSGYTAFHCWCSDLREV